MKKYWILLSLSLIVVIALVLRIYKLDQIPPALNWDEAAVGYNAWTVAHYAHDEWGQFLPLSFKSFGEYKNPVHIYFTAFSVGLLGLSEFSTRLPAALFGVMNVVLIFYLGKLLFKKESIGLIAAFFLAVSPFNIQFSRFNHEANFALFFFMLGIILFLKSFLKPPFLPISVISFCISVLSYNSSKIFLPLIIVLLFVLYFKKIWQMKKMVLVSISVLFLFALLIFFNPSLAGFERAAQTALPLEVIKQTELYKQTGSEFLGRLDLVWRRYFTYFTPQYLFISGDPNPRHSIQTVGAFYKIDLFFLIVGIFYLFYQRSKGGLLLLFWALLAPIPAAITGSVTEISHSARALFQMGSMHLIAAGGFYLLISLGQKKWMKLGILLLGFLILGNLFKNYLIDYYSEYGKKYAIEWQYGMKEIVNFTKQHPEYAQVFVTDIRFQPYIFFLFHLKTPLPDYLNSVSYNNNMKTKNFSSVAYFDRFYFGGWDTVESFPNKGVLYVLTPSQYDGLRHKNLFIIKEMITYPMGAPAFYLVSLD